ncbi:MAG: hypothetical protein M1826_001764 [Phylliscum demangeonii]|nr:MAG: hypothetical protein M1826_001764 [Phylliscum demangeonii]
MLHQLVQALALALLLVVAQGAYVPGKAFDRFITIWLENQDYLKVAANADIKHLSSQGVLLTGYYGVSHPSEPNYIASIGGDYFGLDSDRVVDIPENVTTVVDLLETKRIKWRGYFEDVPGPGFMGETSTNANGQKTYVRKHNPFVNYQSISRNGSRLLNIVSLKDFQQDLQTHSLPQYAHISPNMLSNGHDSSLDFAATWSRDFLIPLLKNEYFMKDTLVLLTYDESETYSKPNQVVSLLLGGAVPDNLKGTTDDTFYTHYSIISTLENNWDLPHLGRYDVGANVFGVAAKKTGYQNHDIDRSLLNQSSSYPGLLNSKSPLPIPPPNPFLTGAGGQGILQTLPDAWKTPKDGHVATPYDGTGNVYDGHNPPVYKTQSATNK